jgi:hypothetical protein
MQENTKTNDCIICFETLSQQPELNFSLGCKSKHTFHLICINQWFQKSNSCPLCREEIIMNSVWDFPLIVYSIYTVIIVYFTFYLAFILLFIFVFFRKN